MYLKQASRCTQGMGRYITGGRQTSRCADVIMLQQWWQWQLPLGVLIRLLLLLLLLTPHSSSPSLTGLGGPLAQGGGEGLHREVAHEPVPQSVVNVESICTIARSRDARQLGVLAGRSSSCCSFLLLPLVLLWSNAVAHACPEQKQRVHECA